MEIYIDRLFIEKFAHQDSHPLHDKLRLFLRRPQTGKKFINFDSFEEFKEAAIENPVLEMLIDSSPLSLRPNFQTEMREASFYDSRNSVLFFNEEEDSDELEANFGCIFINSDSLNKAHFLFNWHLIPFTRSNPRYSNWSFMTQLRHPCNALVITDNYLFAKGSYEKNRTQLDENLLEILYNIMPKTLIIDFHLTIIGSPTKQIADKEYVFLENYLNRIHEYLIDQLSKKFKYDIKLSIVIAPFHDRNILTNYAWLNSGNSFTYFEDGYLHSNTNLMFQPVTHANSTYNPFYHSTHQNEESTSVSEVWENIIVNCQKLTRQTPRANSNFKFLSAPCVNRLLS